ncbi:YbbC/YhhH family protein [Flavisolibacter ginsenosidimutans]|nr:YbbC/YhhH family protein [Flavisolibacter ginsenosidimutans]
MKKQRKESGTSDQELDLNNLKMKPIVSLKFFFRVLSLSILFPLTSCGQDFSDRILLGKGYARKSVKATLGDKNYKPFYDTLIKDKETAIAVVEPILFKIYGKKTIADERPYECYLIDGFWFISGTLPRNSVGGTFEVIFDSKNGRVLKIIHGK